MNAFIQDYDGDIALYSSSTKELIKGGFVSVKEARDWADADGFWTICWVATTEVVKPAAVTLAAQLQAIRNLYRTA